MEKSKELKMLKTAKGQIDGIIKMFEEDRFCFDVSNQLLATIAILKSVNTKILTTYLSKCVSNETVNDEKKIEEVVSIIKKLSK